MPVTAHRHWKSVIKERCTRYFKLLYFLKLFTRIKVPVRNDSYFEFNTQSHLKKYFLARVETKPGAILTILNLPGLKGTDCLKEAPRK